MYRDVVLYNVWFLYNINKDLTRTSTNISSKAQEIGQTNKRLEIQSGYTKKIITTGQKSYLLRYMKNRISIMNIL